MKDSLKNLQICELNILNEVVKICDKNNLTYYMMGGTFLGAIRHKGFIPWDDDIDISLSRPEYEKLLKILKEQLPKNFIIDNFLDNDESLIYATRVEDSNIKVLDKAANVECIRNAWIDIFPLDGMPNNPVLRKFHEWKLLYLRLKFKYSIFSKSVTQSKKHRPLHEKILIFLGNHINFERVLNKNKCLRSLDKALKKYDYNKSKYVVNFMGAYEFKEMFKKEIYENCRLYDFENVKLNAPKEYDFVLTQMYGDYMKLPPVDERNKHCIEMLKK